MHIVNALGNPLDAQTVGHVRMDDLAQGVGLGPLHDDRPGGQGRQHDQGECRREADLHDQR